jgi:hypothetical protein
MGTSGPTGAGHKKTPPETGGVEIENEAKRAQAFFFFSSGFLKSL